MIEKELEVTNDEGLHTRPANSFVREVKRFDADVRLRKGETEVPGKSLLKIMKLGIVQGDTVTLLCDGPDEKKALAALEVLIQPEQSAS